jgi:NAD(P)-dependent dehydrogenase (short-subunit alcohol dehydrogenase family)
MRAIVTGAARGIGRAICLRLARDAAGSGGVRVVVADQHADELDSLVAEIEALGGQAIAVAGDLSDPSQPGKVVEASRALGGLDALVSNAGISIPGPLASYDMAHWDKVFAVNVRAPLMLAQAAYPALKESQGAIVMTTSISGTNAHEPLGAYSASKGAALMLARQLANEWGPDGIRVNAFSPGPTVTPGTARAYASPSTLAQREARIPLRRIGAVEDMAGVVAFLLGKDAAYVHGVDLVVDGGFSNTLMSALDMSGWKA